MYSNFARVYDSLMESVDRKAWLEYIISLFGDAKIERVADCACGTGALSIPGLTHRKKCCALRRETPARSG